MKTFWRIVGIGMVVAVLGSMTLGIVSAKDWPLKGTADKVDSGDTVRREKDGEKSFDRSKELWGAWSRLLIEVASEELGMSARDLWAELKGGATIADLADAQGVDQKALYDTYIVRPTAWLEQAVAEGAISQADADAMLARMQRVGVDLLSKTWTDAGEKDREKDKTGEKDRGKRDWESAWSRLLIEVAAEELGMSARDLWAELKAGSTIAGIADTQGVDQQALYDAYIVRLTEWLDEAVAEGTISQSDADGMLATMQSLGIGILNK